MKSIKNIRLKEDSTIKEALEVIDNAAMQIAIVTDSNDKLVGTITDGDLRRSIAKIDMNKRATSIMKSRPVVAKDNLLISSAIVLMNNHSITSLIIAKQNKPVGIVNIKKCLEND